MSKHKLSAASISSELDTVGSLQAKLGKAEAKKAAKKPRKAKPPAGVKESMPQNGDVPSEEEENQEPGIRKHAILVKCITS